jgi:hypothetical protein
MNHVETRLQATFRSVAANTEVEDRLDEVLTTAAKSHPLRRPVLVGAAVSVTALALLTVGSVLWLRPADQPFAGDIEPMVVELPGGFVVNVAPDSVESEGAVVYVGLPGPEPTFDPATLGTEIALTRRAASDLVMPPSSNPLERNALHATTMVYLGDINGAQIALQASEGGLLDIDGADRLCVFFGNGTPITGGGTCDLVNGLAFAAGATDPPVGDWVVWTGLPEAVAVVTAQTVDGATYWQRPVARTVYFNLPDGTSVRPSTLTALNASGNNITESAPEGVPDLTLTVNPGPGPGLSADELAAMAGSPNIVVVEGTSQRVGWVQADAILFDIIEFRSLGEEPQRNPDEVSTCLAVVSAETGFTDTACHPETNPPTAGSISGWGTDGSFNWIAETGPGGMQRAMVTTTQGRTIEIQTARIVFAAWPITWGPPQSLTFFDQTGTALGTIDY